MKLVFIDGTKGFTPTRIEEKATGGILSSLTILPRLLVKLGHDVTVKCDITDSCKKDGVWYCSLLTEINQADVIIFNRNVLSRDLVSQAKATGAKTLWWLHDVVDPRYLVDDGFSLVDGIVGLSKYCRDTYSSFYGINPNKIEIIPNGIDTSVFNPGKYKNRNPGLMIYASAPIKGMKPLGFLANNYKRMDAKNELRMYSSQRLHDKLDDALVQFQFERAREQGVTILEPIPQKELAQVMKEAWLLLMPNSYPEICSNLLLQARASGLPIVGSPTGSIPEFLTDGKHGTVTKSNPTDLYFWWKEFAESALNLVNNKELHKKMSEACPEGVATWEQIADKWHNYIVWLVKKNGN